MIHGHYYFGRKRVACRNAYCTVCKGPRFTEGFRSLVVLHVGFVPLLPIAIKTRWFCSTCHRETNARLPSRPFILVAGVFFGIVLFLIGLLIQRVPEQKGAEHPGVGVGCSAVGLLMAGSLVWVLRRQDYKGFVAATHSVVPLGERYCPYCKLPFTPLQPRYCPSCKVNIVLE